MSNERETKIVGTVTDVFAHRFVVSTESGRLLADLGPKGAEAITLREGDAVELYGERKPSELKVTRLVKNGGAPIDVAPKETIKAPHKKHQDEPGTAVNAAVGRRAAEASGLVVVGEPRQKPKHVEVLARDAAGAFHELHVEANGTIRRSKPVAADEPKWADKSRPAAS